MAESFYYAYISRHTASEYYSIPSIEFEAVSASKINDYLNHIVKNLSNAQEVNSAVSAFWAKYAHNEDMGLSYINVYFGHPYCNFFVETKWIGLEFNFIPSEKAVYPCSIQPFNPYEPPIEGKFCQTTHLPEDYLTALNHLFSVPDVISEEAAENHAFGGINHATVIGAVRAYYVGAALCVGLIDAGGVLQGFFDLGCHKSGDAGSPQRLAADANYTEITGHLKGAHPLTIIISHWHRDHINIISALDPAEIARHTWICPQSNAPSAARFSRLPGVARIIMPNVAMQNNMPLQVGANFIIYKIDFYPHNNFHPHPHHHGIYAMLSTQLGNKILLSGDCTYAGILPGIFDAPAPTAGSSLILQASHHGGNYALHETTVAPRRASIRNHTGGVLIASRSVFFSANGHTHGHPSPEVMTDHDIANWPAANHILLHSIIGPGVRYRDFN